MKRVYDVDRSIEVPARMFLDQEKYAGYNVALSYLLVLDGPLSPSGVRTAVDSLVAVNPRLRQRITVDDSGPTQWVPTDAQGEVEFVELAARADISEVLDRCSALQQQVFPRNRPPWHVVYYAPIGGGRSVLLVRLHHSVGDGAAALTQVVSAFGGEADRVVWVDKASQSFTAPGHGTFAPPVDDDPCTEPSSTAVREKVGTGNSRDQQMVVLDARPLHEWEAVAARHGVGFNALLVSLASAMMHRYWADSGSCREDVVVTMPLECREIRERSGGLFAIHVPNLVVNQELSSAAGLPELSEVLAHAIHLSEQQTLQMVGSGGLRNLPATPPVAGVALDRNVLPMTDILVTDFGAVPQMSIEGNRVVDFDGFVPVTGCYATLARMEYAGVVKLCLNVDSDLLAQQTFQDCARAVVADLLD